MVGLLERVKFLGGDGPAEMPALGIEDPAAVDPGPDGELVDQLDPDPEPGRRTRRKAPTAKPAKQTRAGGKFTSRATVQKEMAAELDAFAKLLALTWSMSDEHCAGVLNETSANITRDLAALLARSDWVMEKWGGTTLFVDLVKLGSSALPLLRAVWAHHVAGRGRPEEEQEGGHDAVDVADPDRYAPYRPAYSG